MIPGHSTRAAVVPSGAAMPALLMSVPEIRAEIGLFDDTSQDALLTDYIHAATEQCAVVLGTGPAARLRGGPLRRAARRLVP